MINFMKYFSPSFFRAHVHVSITHNELYKRLQLKTEFNFNEYINKIYTYPIHKQIDSISNIDHLVFVSLLPQQHVPNLVSKCLIWLQNDGNYTRNTRNTRARYTERGSLELIIILLLLLCSVCHSQCCRSIHMHNNIK